jgi:hypothetical protein
MEMSDVSNYIAKGGHHDIRIENTFFFLWLVIYSFNKQFYDMDIDQSILTFHQMPGNVQHE